MDDGPRQPINENELPANLKNLWDKAVRALRMQNFDYVIQLLLPIVKEQPLFLDGRRGDLRRGRGGARGVLRSGSRHTVQ